MVYVNHSSLFLSKFFIMKTKLFLLSLILVSTNLFSQHSIVGKFAGIKNKNIYLIAYHEGNQKIIDTTQTDLSGSFNFLLSKALKAGMYVVYAGPDHMLELVYNNEDIEFETTGSSITDNIHFLKSKENQIYYNYVFVKIGNQNKLNLLRPTIRSFPKDDPFYKTMIDEYNLLVEQIDNTVKVAKINDPDKLATRYISSDWPVISPAGISVEEENAYLKTHFLDHLDFYDTALINTSILSSRVVGYLQLFQRKDMTKEQAEEAMKPALDTILQKATLNGEVYGFVLDYLVGGLETVGFDKLLIYLANAEAADNICEDSTRAEVKNKLELAKKLAIGVVAPPIKYDDIYGKSFDLSKVNANKTVLVFWASWCPHCTKTLPELKQLYESNPGKFEVVAVSVDDDIKTLKHAVSDFGFNWINISEGMGWDGKIPLEYGITGTPTFFVLDKEKKIISKPRGMSELKQALALP